MVLASYFGERHPKQVFSRQRNFDLWASRMSRPTTRTQRSGCQQTSLMGLISRWTRFWSRLDPAKPSTHVPEGAPSRSRSEPLNVVVGVGVLGPRQGPTRAAPGLRPGCCPSTATITIGLTQSGRHPTEPTPRAHSHLCAPCRIDPGGGIVLHQFTHIGSGESIGRRASAQLGTRPA
jgi:hypothetical protein